MLTRRAKAYRAVSVQ